MLSRWIPRVFVCSAIILAFFASATWADEGMWLFNFPPKKVLKEKYDFDATDAWLAHLRQSAVRVNVGGSASFVSPNGLVMTNHHIGSGPLHEFSTKERDLLKTGFYAPTLADERPCNDIKMDVLMSIDDVTKRVNDAVTSTDPVTAEKQRREIINTIEQDATKQAGGQIEFRGEVVTLYQGGLYHLYHYKRYTDVRLVFAPEQEMAFFGGDADNFEYPRFDLDVCFFRAYENGKPANVANYLKWNPAGLKQDDLVFVAGHPGHTDRLNTVHHLEFLRDTLFPSVLDRLRRQEVLAMSFAQRSAENARRSHGALYGAQNSRKARRGNLSGLQDPAVMKMKRDEEDALRRAAAQNPELAAEFDAGMKAIDKSLAVWAAVRKDYGLLEQSQAFQSRRFGIARTLLRLAAETTKPNGERLHEYIDANLPSLKQSLLNPAPIYDDWETVMLADSLSFYMEQKGADDPLVQKVMAGKSPEQRAAELIRGTRLADIALREQLFDGGAKAIDASQDPMILLAKLVDEPARKVRATYQQEVEEAQKSAYGKLTHVRFALLGTNSYPDATFTLRLAFGQVKGAVENDEPAPAWTTLGGMFDRAKEHNNVEPFSLPQRWLDRKDRLDLSTPLDFISTDDIIGGNSGSPVVNRDGELVGIIFDGDLPSLVWDFAYTEDGRAISVHGSAILETLRKIYDAGRLADELEGKREAPK